MKKQTLSLHAGYEYGSERTVSVPIYQSTAYNFSSFDEGARRFALKELGNTYTRLTNPTTDVLGRRLAAVENGAFAVPVSSGSAALFYTVANLAESGDNILLANKVYGGTSVLCHHSLKRFGIKTKTFDIDNVHSIEPLIDEDTKAIIFESISNPQIALADIEAITSIAKSHGIVSVCDNTVATPFLCPPFDFGVDVSVHSLSKYINGSGNALGGAVIERHGLNLLLKNNKRYQSFNEEDESYHGLIYANLDLPFFSIRLITEWLRNIGATLSPQNAYYILLGLETLGLRMKAHSDNALGIAKFLDGHKHVLRVDYPGLTSSPYHELARKYLKDGRASGLLSFELKNFEAAKAFCDALKIFSLTANIGDSKSLVIHPASITHSQLSAAELAGAGITQGTIRLSVGLEDQIDLINALDDALSKI